MVFTAFTALGTVGPPDRVLVLHQSGVAGNVLPWLLLKLSEAAKKLRINSLWASFTAQRADFYMLGFS